MPGGGAMPLRSGCPHNGRSLHEKPITGKEPNALPRTVISTNGQMWHGLSGDAQGYRALRLLENPYWLGSPARSPGRRACPPTPPPAQLPAERLLPIDIFGQEMIVRQLLPENPLLLAERFSQIARTSCTLLIAPQNHLGD